MDRLDPRKSALLFYQKTSLIAAFLHYCSYCLPQLHNPVEICVFQQFFQTELRFS